MCSCPEGYLLGHNGRVPPTSDFSPNTDELLGHNDRFVAAFADQGLPLRPRRHLAIVACMDSRMDIFQMLGLAHGDAHVIRNAGGVVTDDVVRSLVLSQRLLGTREIILIHHTDCGMLRFTDDELLRSLHNETGIRPTWAVETFADTEEDLRMSMRRVRTSPFIPFTDQVRGFIYDVTTGRLAEMEA